MMNISRRQALAVTGATFVASRARAAAPVRIGVINDMSGPYADIGGRGSVVAAQMAAADFGGSVIGRPVEILGADHLNKPDVGLPLIREWFGPGGVGMVCDFGNTPVALGTQPMLTQFNKIAIYTSVVSAVLTGKACSPLSAHWAHDSYGTTVPLMRDMVAKGQDTFFFLVADYTFGDIMAADSTEAIKRAGGRLVGATRHPMASSDFASYLLAAQTSGAKVIVMCNGGTDTTNAYKQAVEFGLDKTQSFVAPLLFLSGVHSLGVQTAHGLQFTQSWYWDQTDETRAWSKRYKSVMGTMPNDTHAAMYSAVLNYLRAMAQAGTEEAHAVMASLKALKINDVFAKDGFVRKDGKMIFDRYLARVKKPEQSTGEWDTMEILGTIPAAEGFRPLSESECSFIKA